MFYTLKNIAVLGATGNIGKPIVQALLERKADFGTITALTGSDPSGAKFDALRAQGVHVEHVDLANHAALVAALKGQDALILALGGPLHGNQIAYIDAAIEAGVKRVYPSEFGVDYTIPINQIPFLAERIEVQKYLEEKAKEGKISYTFFTTGALLDWSLATGFLGFNVKTKTALLINGGRDGLNATTTEDAGRFVAASLANPATSHNRSVRVQSYSTSGAEILALLEKHTGSKFTVVDKTSQELAEDAALRAQKGDHLDSFIKNVLVIHFDGHGLYGPVDNPSFPEVHPATLEDTVRDLVAGKFSHWQEIPVKPIGEK